MKYKVTIEVEVDFHDAAQLVSKVQYAINRISYNLGWWGRDDPRILTQPRIVRFEEVPREKLNDGKF